MTMLAIEGLKVRYGAVEALKGISRLSRSFDELEQMGEALSSFDLVVALSPASQHRALELTRFFHLTVDYWPIMDPTAQGDTREAKLAAYRQTRDQIVNQLKADWGSVSA